MADKWFVRGVPTELVQAVTAAAKSRGVTVGRVVTEALTGYVAALDRPRELPAAPIDDHAMADFRRRLEALEAAVWPGMDKGMTLRIAKAQLEVASAEAALHAGEIAGKDTTTEYNALADAGTKYADAALELVDALAIQMDAKR